MHIFKTLQVLIDDILLVDIFEDVGTDDSVKISVHEVEDEVNVTIVFSADYVLKANNVLVTSQLLQEDDLAERALRVSSVLESVEVLLEGDNLFGALVDGLPHDTVRSLTQLLKDFVFLENVRLDLLRHFFRI